MDYVHVHSKLCLKTNKLSGQKCISKDNQKQETGPKEKHTKNKNSRSAETPKNVT